MSSTTVLRTFRIPREIDETLRKEAKLRGISQNALVSMVLTGFSDWDRFADRLGYTSMTREYLRSLLDAVDDKTLHDISKHIASHKPREVINFWFKEINLQTFINYMSLISRHAGWGELESKTEDGRCTLTICHELGPKWSLALQEYLVETLDSLFHVHAENESTEASVTVRFIVPATEQSLTVESTY